MKICSKRRTGLIIILVSLFCLCGWQVLASPTNDNFSGRLVLSGPVAGVAGDNSTATLEPGEHEPVKGMAGATLCYQWQAPAAGLLRVYAQADSFVPAICVYKGNSLKNLARVASTLKM